MCSFFFAHAIPLCFPLALVFSKNDIHADNLSANIVESGLSECP